MSKKVPYMTGINVLVKPLNTEETTSGGILMAITTKSDNELVRGVVINKGPGFLLPFPKNHEDDLSTLLNESHTSPIYLPLDVENGDVVYFPKGSMEPIMLDGEQLGVVPYPSIKVYMRDESR